MSKLTLDEAITHCLEVAEQEECFINYPHSDIVLGDLDIESHKHCATDHRQLAEWLTELKKLREENINLKNHNERLRDCVNSCVRNGELDYAELAEAKRLLKAAVDDIARTESCFLCKYYDNPAESCQTTDDCFVWRYADEAQNLLNDEK